MTLRLAYFFNLVFGLVISLLAGVHGSTGPQRPFLTLMTQNGQMYNCVGFYKQPAFNHPLLKDHVPKVNSILTTSIQGKFNISIGGCPDGTVPIRSSIVPVPHPPEARVHCYAVVRTVLDNTNKQFFGSNASPNLYKPKVQGYQWSASRIKLMNEPDSIEAGWIAGSNGCFNTDCPGFVQVATDLPLGSSPQEYSSIKGKQVAWNISIDKHSDDGNWWLSMTWDSIGTHQIGYWPASLFTVLKDVAAQVEWGGEINNPGAISPAPSMGSSLKAIYDVSLSAHFQHITVVDERSNNVIPQGTEKFYYCPRLYTVLDWGDQGGDLGRVIFYGGSQPHT